ncbi:MAG TPA: glycosyltransferase family 39 protein [Candidatus Sulfopaludibacter sp.]|jgi:hypothetical protein|nr:glycosyltransferase family 39 protein [Candidatus Sulfopaludibacter sp.]
MPRSRTELASLAGPLAAYLLLILLVRPWGDYPLNDDWIYARIGKRFAEAGRFVFDHDTGAAFIGQGVMAAPVIRLLGFSHTHLRSLTMLLGALILYLLWLLLRYAGVQPSIRAAALLTVVWNPLFGYLSFSFMTEIYAYFFALLGAVVWLRDRRGHSEGPLVSWGGAMAAALLVGLGFWIRQYSVLMFPALLGSLLPAGWQRVRASVPRLAASCLIFAATVAAYFVFARTMAEVPMGDYSHRLGRMWPVNIGASLLQMGIFLIYMTAFLLPLLLLTAKRWSRRMLPVVLAIALLGAGSAFVLLQTPPHLNLQPRFPFLGNVINDAGVGPVLLPDVKFREQAGPAWPKPVWGSIECLLLAANVLWVFVIFAAPSTIRKRGLKAELLLMAVLFSLASLAVTTVVDRLAAFDRYYLPEVFGLTLALAVILSSAPRIYPLRFAAALLPLAFFTTAGLHDYFRWNDAAWDLYRQAIHSGIAPASIDAGYEMNGWYNYTQSLSRPAPVGNCEPEWACIDDEYRLGMHGFPHYTPIAQQQPSYWLAPGPPVTLSRRASSGSPW